MDEADLVWEVLARVGSVPLALALEVLIPTKWGRACSHLVQAVWVRAALAEEVLMQMVSVRARKGSEPAALAQAGPGGEPLIRMASAEVHRVLVLAGVGLRASDGVDVAQALGPWEPACQMP